MNRQIVVQKLSVAICSVVLILITIITYYLWDSRKGHSMNSLRLGYSFFEPVSTLDPANIETIYQANLIENIYSRLVSYSNKGEIQCSLCSKFSVSGNEIRFSFDSKIGTADGTPISAMDAQKSLLRILASQTNTHGSLRFYLDSTDSFKKAIDVVDNDLVIKTAKSNWTPFVLALLSSMDFSIIPIGSLSENGSKIINYSNTSGPYYVSGNDDVGNITLMANKNSPLFDSKMPMTVQLIPLVTGEALNFFKDNKIDMIDVTYFSYQDEIDKLLKEQRGLQVHNTLNIGLTSIVFTNSVINRSSEESRLKAGILIKDVYSRKAKKIFGAKNTIEFFQSFGHGFLMPNQVAELKIREQLVASKVFANKFVFGVSEKYRTLFSQSDFPPEIELKFFKKSPNFLPIKDRPDIYIVNSDSSVDEDISALSYLFSRQTFSYNQTDGANWIQKFMDIESREERLIFLNRLHFEMLSKVKIFPISAHPYVTILREGWDLDFSKLYAGTQLWKITKH